MYWRVLKDMGGSGRVFEGLEGLGGSSRFLEGLGGSRGSVRVLVVPPQTWKKCQSFRGHVLLTIEISAKRHIKIVPKI